MSDERPSKIGEGHLGAMARQGLAELRAALYADSNIAQPTEYGAFGRPTPQEVVERKEEGREREESVIDSRLGGEPSAPERDAAEDRAPPEPDRE